jgi:hypothetical protein
VYTKKAHSVANSIGVHKPPPAHGRTGVVRIANVRQGDEEGIKDVHHISCVDSTSQWQVEVCAQAISEAGLLPVLELVLAQFPFAVEGFHADSGSEYLNHRVAKILEKLRMASLQAAMLQPTAQVLASAKRVNAFNDFYQRDFNPWLNLHRPCMFASSKVNPQGKVVKTYKHADVKTPLEALVLLDQQGLVQFKTPNALADLLAKAMQKTDLAAAQKMQRAKRTLLPVPFQKKEETKLPSRALLRVPAWTLHRSTPPGRVLESVGHHEAA